MEYLFFKLRSAQIIILIIQFRFGMEKCVKPVVFFPLLYKVSVSLLNASMLFQHLLTPLGIGKVLSLGTLKNLLTGLDNSFKYSVVMHGPKLGKSYSFYMISYSLLLFGALLTMSITLKLFWFGICIYIMISYKFSILLYF